MSWVNHAQIKEWHLSCFWHHSVSLTGCLNKCYQGTPMKKNTTKKANPRAKPCKFLLRSYQRGCRKSWAQHLPHTQSCSWQPYFLTPFRFDVWINTKECPVQWPMLTNGKEVSTNSTGFPQTWHIMPGLVLKTRPRLPAPQCCSLCCCRAWLNSGCNKMSFFHMFIVGQRGHCKAAWQLVGTFFFSLVRAFGYMN